MFVLSDSLLCYLKYKNTLHYLTYELILFHTTFDFWLCVSDQLDAMYLIRYKCISYRHQTIQHYEIVLDASTK